MLYTHSTALKTPTAHIYTLIRTHLTAAFKHTSYLLDTGRKLHFCFGPLQLPLLCTDSDQYVCKKLTGDSTSVPVSAGSLRQLYRHLTNPPNDSGWIGPCFPTTWEHRQKFNQFQCQTNSCASSFLMNDNFLDSSVRTDQHVNHQKHYNFFTFKLLSGTILI